MQPEASSALKGLPQPSASHVSSKVHVVSTVEKPSGFVKSQEAPSGCSLTSSRQAPPSPPKDEPALPPDPAPGLPPVLMDLPPEPPGLPPLLLPLFPAPA